MSATISTPPGRPILNIAAYKFVPLDDLENRRQDLKERCESLELKGTILLSPEGINLFLAGLPEHIARFVDTLRNQAEFCDLETKESFSAEQPFRRMLVRLKKEIIAFGLDDIAPAQQTSPKLPAAELKQWLDEGKKLRLLDVRNDYEFQLGTFRGAEQLHIDHFRDFPKAVEQLPEEAKREPVVMFCTGGIRCEKAGPMMEKAGFQEVYQLEGGILKYFEECGGAHYDGSCFVFDGRVALTPELQPTGNLLCFVCQAVLDADDIASGKYSIGEYCPHCYREPGEVQQQALTDRQASILDVARSQPGSQPYVNVRHMFVPGKSAGIRLIDFLCQWHPQTARENWLKWIQEGQIFRVRQKWQVRETVPPDHIVKEGECFEQQIPDTIEPEINPEIAIIHEDASLLVVNKPAPLPVHPSGRFHRNTLSWILSQVYRNEKLRVCHRLDAETSGLVVLCRKHTSARVVQPQFNDQRVKKSYLARVHGHPTWDSMQCDAPISKEPGPGGSRSVDPNGLAAQTSFRVVKRFPDGTSLLEVCPKTGRTHQIRVHLQSLGFPIVGDRMYAAAGGTSHGLRNAPGDKPMCLQASALSFIHPESNSEETYTAPQPDWADG